MKVLLPPREVDCCDICRTDRRLLQKCSCCGREYCPSCQGWVGTMMCSPTTICVVCKDRDDVRLLCADAEEVVRSVLRGRDAKIADLEENK